MCNSSLSQCPKVSPAGGSVLSGFTCVVSAHWGQWILFFLLIYHLWFQWMFIEWFCFLSSRKLKKSWLKVIFLMETVSFACMTLRYAVFPSALLSSVPSVWRGETCRELFSSFFSQEFLDFGYKRREEGLRSVLLLFCFLTLKMRRYICLDKKEIIIMRIIVRCSKFFFFLLLVFCQLMRAASKKHSFSSVLQLVLLPPSGQKYHFMQD